MERVISIDERIKRAEELYTRRKMQGGIRVSSSSVNNSKSNIKLFKKMIIQIIICAIIYAIFYGFKSFNMVQNKNIINDTQKIISYDININELYSNVIKFINETIIANIKINENNMQNESVELQPDIEKNEEQPDSQNTTDSEEIKQNIESDNNTESNSIKEEELGIGGERDSEEEVNTEKVSIIQKSQMEIDAEYVKNNYSIMKPLEGIVTSRFGPREATEIISANHKGIDIGANKGTKIYAAMEGTVTKVSSYGDYGNHLKITNGNVTTLYAHCNKIYVQQGQKIAKGQEIAEVGSTGRTTGPHLHFEIQVDDRVVNPDFVLSF